MQFQFIKINEAIIFLKKHQNEFGINMKNVIIAGGSAQHHKLNTSPIFK